MPYVILPCSQSDKGYTDVKVIALAGHLYGVVATLHQLLAMQLSNTVHVYLFISCCGPVSLITSNGVMKVSGKVYGPLRVSYSCHIKYLPGPISV